MAFFKVVRGDSMNFKVLPQSQWRVLSNLQNSTSQIREKCSTLIGLFEDLATNRTLLGSGAVAIERMDGGDVLANVKTSLGNGRFILLWEFGDAELLGRMVFQRECSDKYDKLYWETIGELKVPVYEDPYSGSGATLTRIELHAYFEQDRRSSVMNLLISMLYGIANGPTVDGQ
jgi:hypothetical protein